MKLQYVDHKEKFLSKKRITVAPFLIFLIVSIYAFVVNVGDGYLDIYGATIFYYNWVDEIAKLQFSLSGLAETYNVTLKEISAPEPISGILVYFITSFIKVSTNVFHLINVLVLILFAYFIKNTFKEKVLFALMFIVVITGYYEYVLLHMTHRFKISLLFLMLSLYFANKKQGLSEALFVFSLLSHFSMIAILPMIFCLRRLGFTVLPRFSVKKSVATIGIVSLVYIFNAFEGSDTEYLTLIFFNKFNQSSLPNQAVFTLISLLLFYGIFKKFFNRFNIFGPLFYLGALFIYIVLSLSFIGTSRLLMVYYITFLLIYLANYPYFSPRKRTVIFALFSPLFFYNFINGFIKGPIAIVYDAIL